MYIAFDLGNVLLDVDFSEFWKEVEYKNIDTFLFEKTLEYNERFEFTGLVDINQIIENYMIVNNNNNYIGSLIKKWCESIKPNETMLYFLKEIPYYVKIAYWSNIGKYHLDYLNNTYPEFMKLAQLKHMSCEIGVAKPSTLFYTSFPLYKEFLYIDDRIENINAATELGINSYHFDLKEEIKNKTINKSLNYLLDKILHD